MGLGGISNVDYFQMEFTVGVKWQYCIQLEIILDVDIVQACHTIAVTRVRSIEVDHYAYFQGIGMLMIIT